jgi:PTH1 family peptidyl-tRNA hydrolase
VKLVVGLGNPGPRYAGTRHNIGYRIAECFATTARIPVSQERFHGLFGEGVVDGTQGGERAGVLLPLTFMNKSGDAVAEAMEGLALAGPDQLFVIYDDMSLPFGRIRVRARGGGGSHNGVSDVIDALETKAVPRLRFGIGEPRGTAPWIDHVLGPFDAEEERLLDTLVPQAAEAVRVAVTLSVTEAMNQFNASESPET